jgi:hypothetical protein
LKNARITESSGTHQLNSFVATMHLGACDAGKPKSHQASATFRMESMTARSTRFVRREEAPFSPAPPINPHR